MNQETLRLAFPDLFRTFHQGTVQVSFDVQTDPPVDLISNVNIVPFCRGKAVVLRLESGQPEIPGGTLEPGERWIDALRRELMEEAGAELQSFTPLGAWRWTSSAAAPYRAHLPHPISYRFVGFGDIMLVSRPTNPPDGEQIASVDVVQIDEAVRLFIEWERPDIAALYHIAGVFRPKDAS